MKKSAFTEEQITNALRQVEAGAPVAELRRLRQLEEEHRQLKQLVADLTLDKHMRQVVRRKQCSNPPSAESWCRLCGWAFRGVRDAHAA